MIAEIGGRRLAALGALVLALLAVPIFADNYIVSVMIVFLLAAYLGQTWNILMGFVGQLSIGHALYYGLGAYVAASLYVHFAMLPWLGMLAGAAVAALVGAAIGALSFRFGVAGVYFALLTIAFNEFTHILFNHFAWVGGSAGLFLPVKTLTHEDVLHLRGSPALFYYLLLALVFAVLALSHALLRHRTGYYWQAIREDQPAAQSLGIDVFRYKLLAMTLSAALTALAGALMAFYDNNLYPDTVFTTARSVEIITAPIIGGIGSLMGPIVGAFVLTVMGEALTNLSATIGIPGFKQFFYGAALVAIVMVQPAGLWPWLKRSLRL